jgi:membrane protein DedA with SNARE-associated domain
MGLTEFLATYITKFIEWGGYWTLTLLMTMESIVLPVPSEAVMPFAGFLVASGKFSFVTVAIFSTIGSIIGSTLSYIAGYYGGKPFVLKFGKYLLLNEDHLHATEKFFHKFGDATVFIARFIPIVRHLSSIPAGVGRMSYWRFILMTAVGAFAWNCTLTWCGFFLKNNWNAVMKFSKIFDLLIILAIVALVVWFVWKRLSRMKKDKASA